MKCCDKCRYLSYNECELFGDDVPDFLDTGDGCKLKRQEVEKLLDLEPAARYGCYAWYGRKPTEQELETYKKAVKAYDDYWEHIKRKYGVKEK